MKCNNCGYIMKINRKYCKKCGINIQEFNRINNYETEVNINKLDILSSILLPIRGFILWINYKKKKKTFLFSSIIGIAIYVTLITFLLISLITRKVYKYSYIESEYNKYRIKMTIKLNETEDKSGTFKLSGYEKIDYKETIYEYYYGYVKDERQINLYAEIRYSAKGYWVRTSIDNLVQLTYTKETIKLIIRDDYDDVIEKTVNKTFSPIIGEEKTNDLLNNKKVVLTYEIGTAVEYIKIDDTYNIFKFYEG